MSEYTDSFNEHAESLRESVRQADFDNLQHSLSDVETGELTKHGLDKNDIDPLTGKKKLNAIEEALQRTLDWLLLNDPHYAALYNQAWDGLNKVENLTETALEHAEQALSEAQDNLNDILDRAARLSDGTRVFRDAHGDVWTEHGVKLDAEQAAEIEWRGGEPSREAFINGKADVEGAQSRIDELRNIQVEIGGYRNEMRHNDNPPSSERLNEMQERMLRIQSDLTNEKIDHKNENIDTVKRELNSDVSELSVLPKIKNF